MFHYSTKKLRNPILRVVRILHVNFLTYLVICLFNFINNIVQAAVDFAPGVYIFYSILNMFIFLPFALFVFYSGFYGMCMRPPRFHLLAYRIAQGLQVAIWLTLSIISLGPFNGWAQIGPLGGSGGEGFAIFLCVVESILYTVTMITGAI